MKTYRIKLKSLKETEQLGLLLGKNCRPGFVYCLDGDLGAGKTTLTQAIGKGLHLLEDHYISSPSFAIMHEYDGTIPIYHMDFYRLHGADDILALGFDEYFYKHGLTVIEWPSRAQDILPEEILTIAITLTEDGARIFSFEGSRLYDDILLKIKENYVNSEIS